MKYTLDATHKKIGRLASEIALILQNKKSVYYNPRLAGNDTVLVENIDKLDIPATKLIQKIYHRHTGYMGHLKELTLKQVFERSPEKVLRLAVSRMLPKNFLRAKRMKRLTIKRSV
ncbi:MAG TPA: 50S ribosomal protein L13 [Candidatus Paceibacterota bacterium]